MLTAGEITIIVAVLLTAALATPAIIAFTTQSSTSGTSPTISPTTLPTGPTTLPTAPTTLPTGPTKSTPLNIGSTVKCTDDAKIYRYVGQNTLRHYPNDTILHSYKDAVVPTEIDCQGMAKGADMVYSIPTNSFFRCKVNAPQGCLNKTLYSANEGDSRVMCLDSDSAPPNAKSLITAFGDVDCLGFVVSNPTKQSQ